MEKELERTIKNYFIANGIPLTLRGGINTILMTIYGHKEVNCCKETVCRFAKKWFPEKPKKIRLSTYILNNLNKKLCTKCNNIFDKDNFHINKDNYSNLSSSCKNCRKKYHKKYYLNNKGSYLAKDKRRKLAKLNRVPKWANIEKIKEIYKNSPEGRHVDHIIPLQGENISGLHIETNLQYLTEKDNLSKGNKWPYDDYKDTRILPEL